MPVMPSTGTARRVGRLLDPGAQRLAQGADLGPGDRARDREPVAREHRVGLELVQAPQVEVAVADDGVDHPDQAHPLAVLGREDA